MNYEGPPLIAVQAARLLADAEGVELTSATRAEQLDGSVESVRMSLVVEGTTAAVTSAVDQIRDGLPSEASLTIDPVAGA